MTKVTEFNYHQQSIAIEFFSREEHCKLCELHLFAIIS